MVRRQPCVGWLVVHEERGEREERREREVRVKETRGRSEKKRRRQDLAMMAERREKNALLRGAFASPASLPFFLSQRAHSLARSCGSKKES